jgi:hypothetical protein
LPSSAVLNMRISTTLLEKRLPWRDEEPQTKANGAYVCAASLFFSVGNSTIQTESADLRRGRLMGIWALVFGGSLPTGSFWMGVVAQRVGSGHALQVGGVFYALGAATVHLLSPKMGSTFESGAPG